MPMSVRFGRALLCSILPVLLSCGHYTYYVPNQQSVPLFREAGEANISGAIGGGEYSTNIQLNAAYSLTGHFALQADMAAWSSFDGSSGQLYELAPGYFAPFAENYVFEIYGGAGKGITDFPLFDLPYDYITERYLEYDRYFIQPGFGYSSRIIDLAYSMRLCFIDYYGYIPRVALKEYEGNNLTKQLYQFGTLDPAVTIRFGWRFIKIQTQFLYSFGLHDKNIDSRFRDRANLSFGFNFAFGGHFTRKQTPAP